MKLVKVDGVDCFVFLEYLALDKGAVINILTPIDANAPEAEREYVNHRNWIGIGKETSTEAEQLAARLAAKAAYNSLTLSEVATKVAEAKESINPTKKE